MYKILQPFTQTVVVKIILKTSIVTTNVGIVHSL